MQQSLPSQHPESCEGDLTRLGDPTTWTSWLSIRDEKTGELRPRRFHNHDCLERWIDARKYHTQERAA